MHLEPIYMVIGIFVLLCVVFVGLTPLVVARGKKRQERAWGRVAAKLGLNHASGRIRGRLRGRSVQCRVLRSGSGQNRTVSTAVSTLFDPPLDLGLLIMKREATASALDSIIGGPAEIELDDSSAKEALTIHGDEPQRVRTALRPEAVAALLRARARKFEIRLCDSEVYFGAKGIVINETWLERALTSVVECAELLEAGLVRVPIASPLAAHHDAWSTYAEANGLDLTTTPLCMSGELDGWDISVRAVRTTRLEYQPQFLLRFPSSLSEGLLLRPAGSWDAIASFFGSKDRKIGDKPFDDAFVIRSDRPERLGQILDRSVRQSLLRLAQKVGEIELGDEGVAITLATFPEQASFIPDLAGTLDGVMREIYDNATRVEPAARGAYR